jgi:hypothetical protein
MSPRKKVLGPAHPRQVLEYFNQAELAGVEVVFDLVQQVVEQRRREEAPAVARPGTAVKAPRPSRGKKTAATPETYGGESLSQA